ncbi:MAG: hypothetical protein WBG43_07025 [Marinifilaceae bacterium]
MSNVIYLESKNGGGKFTPFLFYNDLMPKVRNHYAKNGRNKPSLSLENIESIDPIVLPNLLGLGKILKEIHGEAIELILDFKPKLLYYLSNTNFFKYAALKTVVNPLGKDLFHFEEGFIGGFSGYVNNEQRDCHKIFEYKASFSEKSSEDIYCHDEVIEALSPNYLFSQFGDVLQDVIDDDALLYNYFESLSEPISNGIVHSQSSTFLIAQKRSGGASTISISDTGIGFAKSFKSKKYINRIIPLAKANGLYKETLEDFFYILEALYISTIKRRHGLIDFLLFAAKNGTVRIHYSSTQIVVTPRILNQCEVIMKTRENVNSYFSDNLSDLSDKLKEEVSVCILELGKVLLSFYSRDKYFSAIRIFNTKFSGIHYEIEIGNKA